MIIDFLDMSRALNRAICSNEEKTLEEMEKFEERRKIWTEKDIFSLLLTLRELIFADFGSNRKNKFPQKILKPQTAKFSSRKK